MDGFGVYQDLAHQRPHETVQIEYNRDLQSRGLTDTVQSVARG